MSSKGPVIHLSPFSREGCRNIELHAQCWRDEFTINIEYTAKGEINRIQLPKRNAPTPQRMGGLWETTCFELFLKNIRGREYLEFNFAPTGNWNCFHFDDYRSGMREYNGISRIDITFKEGTDSLGLMVKIDFKERRNFMLEDFEDGDIKASVCAVVENTQKIKSYWALKHYAKNPDFHLEDNFTLQV